MELEQTNDDLRDLIENPRENEGIEVKAWVDLDAKPRKPSLHATWEHWPITVAAIWFLDLMMI